MHKVLAGVAALAAQVNCDPARDPAWPQFQAFVEKFGRTYASASETAGRFDIFKDNLKRIEKLNAKGQETHGINKFADMTKEEFSQQYLNRRDHVWAAMTHKHPTPAKFSDVRETAASIDWCAKGACTPVKNQGQCGSCWAFGGTESVESDYFNRFGTLYDLSTQQITSCDTLCYGCGGGNAVAAWQYVSELGGQVLASEYPYTSGTTQQSGTCVKSEIQSSDFKVGVENAYWFSTNATEEGNMLIDIEQTPISVAVDAEEVWQTYTGGIITASSGCGTSLDHNVQVTGYNAQGNYWIVRNSWGTAWGNEGFIYVEAGSNVCGIAMEAAGVVTQQPTTKVAV